MISYVIGLLVLVDVKRTKIVEARSSYHNLRGQTASVKAMLAEGFLQSDEIAKVLSQIDLELFEASNLETLKFLGFEVKEGPLPMYAQTLELLKDHLLPRNRAMDVSGWSGYLTVCMAMLVGQGGLAVSVSTSPDEINGTIAEHMPYLLEDERVKIVAGGPKEGASQYGPYNAIHLGVAVLEEPKELLDQLCVGGRLIIPEVEPSGTRTMVIYDKVAEGNIVKTKQVTPFTI